MASYNTPTLRLNPNRGGVVSWRLPQRVQTLDTTLVGFLNLRLCHFPLKSHNDSSTCERSVENPRQRHVSLAPCVIYLGPPVLRDKHPSMEELKKCRA